jgi:hypothetical protein
MNDEQRFLKALGATTRLEWVLHGFPEQIREDVQSEDGPVAAAVELEEASNGCEAQISENVQAAADPVEVFKFTLPTPLPRPRLASSGGKVKITARIASSGKVVEFSLPGEDELEGLSE